VTESLSDVISIARRVTSVDVAPQFDNYSKVIIHVSDETAHEAGNDTGRTLEIDNPFGTQQMADDILASLTGFQYQPYYADGALLDPAAEIGDAVNMRGAYGGIYTRERTFGRLMKADVSAPHDEEINHEYQYESPERREFTRAIGEVKASLIIANDNIEAKVSQESPEGQTSFSWRLLSDSHKWYANGNEVMSVSASGLKVTGEIQATSGKIGNFNISATAIWNNISSFGGTQTSGVYVGTDGIQLGQAFKVTPTGAVTANNISANNMTLTGTLNIGGTNITAAALRSGAQSAYNNSGTWSTGAGYGYNYNSATASSSAAGPAYFNAGQVRARNTLVGGSLACNGAASVGGNLTVFGSFRTGGYYATWITKTIAGTTITYLGR
jgi:hypothetical protein